VQDTRNPYKQGLFIFVMGLFGFRKKDKVIDLTEHFNTQNISSSSAQMSADTLVAAENDSSNSDPVSNGLGFLGSIASTVAGSNAETATAETTDLSFNCTTEDRKKKLASRLMDMTSKIEDLNNQIYRMQQRLEVLERKNDVSGF
jgi:hypothetical protein